MKTHLLVVPPPHKTDAEKEIEEIKTKYPKRYLQDNKMLFSVIDRAIADASGSAITIVQKHEDAEDGFKTLKELYEWYESQGSVQDLRTRLWKKLTSLQLTPTTSGWADGYIGSFQEIVTSMGATGEVKPIDLKHFF